MGCCRGRVLRGRRPCILISTRWCRRHRDAELPRRRPERRRVLRRPVSGLESPNADFSGATSFNTFCVDLFDDVYVGQQYLVNPRSTNDGLTNGPQIAYLYNTYGIATISTSGTTDYTDGERQLHAGQQRLCGRAAIGHLGRIGEQWPGRHGDVGVSNTAM